MKVDLHSKLPGLETTIFTVMSKLATDHQAINLSQGFPNYDCSPELIDLVKKNLMDGNNQYAPMAGILGLREALCEKANKLYDIELNPAEEVTITAGATQAIYTALCLTS